MENMENVENQQQLTPPTYEELMQAYAKVVNEFKELDAKYQILLFDKSTERASFFAQMVKDKNYYSDKTNKLAEWHLNQILQKPKKQ